MKDLRIVEVDDHFKDIQKIYDLNLEAFPEEERIPNEKLLLISKRSCGKVFAFYDKDTFVGFTIGSYSKEYAIYYVWFLAVHKDVRSSGYGSIILDSIQKEYPQTQIVIEIEVLDPESENYEERVRRYEFYARNGFEKSEWGVSYFGADFQILSKPAPFRRDDYVKFWNSLWQTKAPEVYLLESFPEN